MNLFIRNKVCEKNTTGDDLLEGQTRIIQGW